MAPHAAPLTAAQQERYLMLLVQGASLLYACRRLDVPLASVLQAMQDDDGFRDEVERAGEALSSQVAAALYKSAVGGSVTAQMFWLRSRPPSDWFTRNGNGRDELDELSDAELFEKCLEEGLPIPPEAEAVVRAALGEAGA